MRDYCDAAYTLLVDSIRGPEESLFKALERANDLFLSPHELARKQNKEAFKKLNIPKPGPGVEKRVVPFS